MINVEVGAVRLRLVILPRKSFFKETIHTPWNFLNYTFNYGFNLLFSDSIKFWIFGEAAQYAAAATHSVVAGGEPSSAIDASTTTLVEVRYCSVC